MLSEILKNKFPFAHNYFQELLELKKQGKRNFPQAIIFEGEDTVGQYLFALELARILNCEFDGDINCTCTNCKWIRSFTHPCVNNVSQIHFKGEDDTSTTVISVKQARQIEKNLTLSSDYHRFFIFFSSSKKENNDDEVLNEFRNLGYSDEIDYSIEPLNLYSFNVATPNALLKSIEEPPENTTFIFLTKAKENILQTIVSRCLVFKLAGARKKIDYSIVKNLFDVYPNITYKNALDISDNLLDLIKTQELDMVDVLNMMAEFLKDLIKSNIDNDSLILKINNDIKLINSAIKMNSAKMQDKVVVETLLLKIARGY